MNHILFGHKFPQTLKESAQFCTFSSSMGSFRSRLKEIWPKLFDTTLPTSKQYTLLKLLGFYSKESQSMAAGARLYTDCIKRTDDEQFGLLKALELERKFLPRFQSTALHFWLSLCRLRAVGQPLDGKTRLELPVGDQVVSPDRTVFSEHRTKLCRECSLLSNGAYDRFWREMSRRLYQEEGLNSRQVSKYSTELEKIFYGSLLLLDECAKHAMEGDQGASLKEAIDKDWRSLAVDGPRKLALEQYIRSCLKELQRVPDDVVLQGTMWLRVIMPNKMDMAKGLQNLLKENKC
ncbi:hypothetical protein GpartN1_g6247.t1 [Galdieria partita]|uniref:Ubiquinol-cytochrome c chaperone domain-containing protein n=1 Tax=Galdieria partita TaxID=83374 RepID=A0A9C7USW5_9RHOD|nr:hypothetical protein GpartN1_g6247.t1 [Galdieria partita]